MADIEMIPRTRHALSDQTMQLPSLSCLRMRSLSAATWQLPSLSCLRVRSFAAATSQLRSLSRLRVRSWALALAAVVPKARTAIIVSAVILTVLRMVVPFTRERVYKEKSGILFRTYSGEMNVV